VDLTVIAVTFASIFVVELPDKTFIAALVLSTRYKPIAVWVGVRGFISADSEISPCASSRPGRMPRTPADSRGHAPASSGSCALRKEISFGALRKKPKLAPPNSRRSRVHRERVIRFVQGASTLVVVLPLWLSPARTNRTTAGEYETRPLLSVTMTVVGCTLRSVTVRRPTDRTDVGQPF